MLTRSIELFDIEVLAIIEIEERLRELEIHSINLKNNSTIEFMATYLLRRPHPQSPWNANMSSLLNTLVDDMLPANDQSLDMSLRREHLSKLSLAVSQNCPSISLIPRLFTDFGTIEDSEEMPYEYFLLRARIITGQPVLEDIASMQLIDTYLMTGPYILGTLVNSAIWGRQYDLFRCLIRKEIEVGESVQLAGAAVHESLGTAVLCGDLEAVHMLYENPWKLEASGLSFNAALERASALGHVDIVDFLHKEAESQGVPVAPEIVGGYI